MTFSYVTCNTVNSKQTLSRGSQIIIIYIKNEISTAYRYKFQYDQNLNISNFHRTHYCAWCEYKYHF